MDFRREAEYPPYARLARLIIRAEKFDKAGAEAERLHAMLTDRIREQGSTASLIGPAPCFYARQDGLYRWHVIIRGTNPIALLEDVRPGLSLQVDVDPVSLL
jgi:primosomal protein N' (replication factor Y)